MARVTFEEATEMQNAINPNYVESFVLKNDGDEALVRFMHDDVSSFDIVTTHSVTINGKFRSVNCLRNPKEPMENCPLCASGANTQNVMFIHLIEYRMDDKNNIVPVPKVWARGLSYATRIKSLINEYGPLSQCLFKIHRNGAAGSRETSYDILFAPDRIYPSQNYPIPEGAFENYSATGTIVLDKSFEDLSVFVNTGRMPEAVQESAPSYGAPNRVPQTTQFVPSGASVGYPQAYTPQPQINQATVPQQFSAPNLQSQYTVSSQPGATVTTLGSPVESAQTFVNQYPPQAPRTPYPMQDNGTAIPRPVRN